MEQGRAEDSTMPQPHQRAGATLGQTRRLTLSSLEPSLEHAGETNISGEKGQNGHAGITRETGRSWPLEQ